VDALASGIAGQWSFRNKLINGNFDYWQRGTSFNTSGYCADRWRIETISNVIVSRGIAAPPYGKYALWLSPKAAVNELSLAQVIEKNIASTLAGKKANLSFQANSGVPQSITAYIQKAPIADQAFIENGWITIASKAYDLGPASQNFSLSADIPNDGTAVGLRVAFAFNNAANGISINLWGCQLEEGHLATPFEFRGPTVELSLCQRYYEKSYDPEVSPGTAGAQGCHISAAATKTTAAAATVYYKVPKRISPTLTYYALNSGEPGKSTVNGTDMNGPSGSAYTKGLNGFELYWSSGVLTTGVNIHQHWTADAEI